MPPHTLGFFVAIGKTMFFTKKLILLIGFLFLASLLIPVAIAYASTSSAQLEKQAIGDTVDNYRKVTTLYNFLDKYNSPLKSHARTFVEQAERYNLDYRLLAAISGVESTFGRQLPDNSYNAWGWGIYGDNMIRFASYPEAISTISQSLRENYINKWGAQNVYQIGRFYAASPTWAQRVVYFMGKIEDNELSLSL